MNDPYESDKVETTRTAVRIDGHCIQVKPSLNDLFFIRACHGKRDTLQTVIHKLIYEFANELRKSGIGPGLDRERFEYYIANVRVLLPGVPGRTSEKPDDKAVGRDDRRGVTGAPRVSPGSDHESDDAPSSRPSKKGKVAAKSAKR